MSSENTVTGRNGKKVVAGVQLARITQWACNPTLASSSEWGDSDSAGHTNRAEGRRDNTFTSEGKYDSATEVYDTFQPGDIALCTLFMNAVAPLLYYDYPRALCNDFSITVDVDTEEVIGWTSAWGEDGASTRPGEVGQIARTLP